MNQALERAVDFFRHGKFEQAERTLNELRNSGGETPDALHLLALIKLETGHPAAAVEPLKKALEDRSDSSELLALLGTAYRRDGRLEEAVGAFEKAVALDPDQAGVLYNFGNALRDVGRLEDAAKKFQKAAAIDPGFTDARFNLGNVFHLLDRQHEAAEIFEELVAANPSDIEAHWKLGFALVRLGRPEDAVPVYNKAIAVDPNNAETHDFLGGALKKMGKLDEAAGSYRNALSIDPNSVSAHNNLGNTLMEMGKMDEAIACFRKALAINPELTGAEKNILFALLNVPGITAEELFAEHVRFAENHTRDIVDPAEDLTNDADPDRRLRIGYLSTNLRDHPVGINVFPLISCHDRKAFEIFCYVDGGSPDAMTERFQASVDHWRPTDGMTDADVAAMVRSDEIDVLVCLAGHFDNNRLLVCAQRTAPVQVSFHDGATSGLQEMDYWLTDNVLHPPETKELFTEELYRMPVFYQYPPIEDAPPVGTLPADQAGFITFGSFNNPAKINDRVIRLWAEILNAVPESRLLLKYKNWYDQPSLRDRVVEQFAASEIGQDRIQFAASIETAAEHLGRYDELDIALDTFPFNGATTTYQALWMGVPVVSLAGETFISRAAGSILRHAGLEDMVAETPKAYVACAGDLAGDLARLKALRTGLRERMAASPLCDAPAYARGVEDAYRTMWRKWCDAHKNTS